MKTKINIIYLLLAFSILVFNGCNDKDEDDGVDTKVYYSEWITPSAWLGESGDWYFSVDAPEVTADILEKGVILAYAALDGDIYEAAVRPLPAYAVDSNWDFLIPDYEIIEFTSDMIAQPVTAGNNFRFITIPGNSTLLKSASMGKMSETELKSMSYKDVCKLFNIPE